MCAAMPRPRATVPPSTARTIGPQEADTTVQICPGAIPRRASRFLNRSQPLTATTRAVSPIPHSVSCMLRSENSGRFGPDKAEPKGVRESRKVRKEFGNIIISERCARDALAFPIFVPRVLTPGPRSANCPGHPRRGRAAHRSMNNDGWACRRGLSIPAPIAIGGGTGGRQAPRHRRTLISCTLTPPSPHRGLHPRTPACDCPGYARKARAAHWSMKN